MSARPYNVLFLCPLWPGKPITSHWGVEDPAAASGNDDAKRTAFMRAFATLQKRIALLVSLRLEALDERTMEQRLKQSGQER